jgi:hypothetical protein
MDFQSTVFRAIETARFRRAPVRVPQIDSHRDDGIQRPAVGSTTETSIPIVRPASHARAP